MILGTFIGAFSVQGWNKYYNKPKGNNNTELQKYDNVDAPALFTSTDNNPSYKHIRNSSDDQNQDSHQHHTVQQNLRECYPLYEDPDDCLRTIED